jgi:NADPH2:quinone reductase
MNLPLLKGCSIVGVSWGGFTRREPARYAESVSQLCQWYSEGRLRPDVDRTFPLERAAEALTLMATRRVKGKIVLTVATGSAGL